MLNFPDFERRTTEIQETHAAAFELAGCMFSAWINRPVQRWLFTSELPGEVLGMTYLLNIQACRQFRSVVELCKAGEGENAEILARSLFETVLAAHFILAEDFPIVAVPKLGKGPRRMPLKDKWIARKREPGDHSTPLTREHRALLFRAHCVSQKFGIGQAISKRHLLATGEELTPVLDEKKHKVGPDQIGEEWTYIQSNRPRTYSGCTVLDQSQIAGHWFPVWYEAVYRSQSLNVHGVDPISYANIDVATEVVTPRWLSTDNTIHHALYCASILFLGFAKCLHENICMGGITETLIHGFAEDVRSIYGPKSAVD